MHPAENPARDPAPVRAALWYAREFGWRVFPCAPRSKAPLTTHGFQDASADPGQIRAWWRQWPDANVAIATGAPGPVVIDIDPPHGGDAWMDATDPALLATLTALSGNGGWHKYYLAPAGAVVPSTVGTPRTGLAPGVDTRGVGGYIIAPPSVHPNGTPYRWSDAAGPRQSRPAVLPAVLLEALTAVQDVQRPAPLRTAVQDVQRPAPAVLLRLAGERGGGRNEAGFWLACQLRDNGYSEGDAVGIVQQYQSAVAGGGDHPYTLREALASLTQAYRRSPRRPWTVLRPPAVQDVHRLTGNGHGSGLDPPAAPAIQDVQRLLESDALNPEDGADVAGDELAALVTTLAGELAAAQAALAAEQTAHAATRAQLARRDTHVAWTHDLLRTANVSAGVLRSLYFARWEVEWQTERARSDPAAPAGAGPVPVNIQHIADVSQQSPAVVGRHLQKAAALGLIERQATKRAGADGQVHTEVAVSVGRAFLEHPSTLAPPDTGGRGGTRVRRCGACGSTALRAETLRCQECGHHQPADDPADLATADALLAAGTAYGEEMSDTERATGAESAPLPPPRTAAHIVRPTANNVYGCTDRPAVATGRPAPPRPTDPRAGPRPPPNAPAHPVSECAYCGADAYRCLPLGGGRYTWQCPCRVEESLHA